MRYLQKPAAVVLSLLLLFSLFCCVTFGAGEKTETVLSHTVVYYEDGSRLETTLVQETSPTRGTITGNKDRDKYNSSNEHVWRVRLTGTFTYNGTTSSCTAASTACTFYKSGWSVMYENTTHSGNTASTTVLLGKKILTVIVPQEEVNLTLTCDKDGNLS